MKKKKRKENIQLSSVQSLSRFRLFVTPWTAARQASLSITNSQSLLKLMSTESVIPSSHVILYCPLLLPSICNSLRGYSLLFQPTGMPKNTGVGSLSLLQSIFQPRNQTRVSCIAGRFFTSWATREALIITALSCILSTKSVGFCDGTFIVFKVVMLCGESDYGKLRQQLVESICNIFLGSCSYRPLSLTDGITQSPYASSVPSRLGDHPYPKKFQEADLYCHPCSIPYPTTLQSLQAHSVIIQHMY